MKNIVAKIISNHSGVTFGVCTILSTSILVSYTSIDRHLLEYTLMTSMVH
jgi:hypothetical protein